MPIEPRVGGVGGGTCAAYFRGKGIPAVVWGQSIDCAHMPNERASLEHMEHEIQVFALMMQGYLISINSQTVCGCLVPKLLGKAPISFIECICLSSTVSPLPQSLLCNKIYRLAIRRRMEAERLKVSEIAARIEKRIPLGWAEEWDHPGLAAGDPDADVTKIALALDVTCETVEGAAAAGCELLVTHHPAIFRPFGTVVYNIPAQKAVALALRKGLALYAAHTNWDVSPEGVNVILAAALELADVEPLVKPAVKNGSWGLGSVGSLPASVSMDSCVLLAAERWRLTDFRAYGDAKRKVRRVALGGGACADLWPLAKQAGADVFITSDARYNERNDALSAGLNLISTDHGETERVSLPKLAELVECATGLPVKMISESGPRRID